MRLIKFLAILVLGMVSSVFVCSAQYDSYYKPDNGLTVTTKPNAELYPLPESYHAAVASGEAFSYGVRDVVKLGDDKPKVVRKPQTLNVMRYTNIVRKEAFDAYIVEYKEKLWVLSEEHVTQNDALVARSTKLANYGDDLKQKYQAKLDKIVELNGQNASTKRELDSLIDKFSATCRDSIEYYRELKSRLPHMRDSLIAKARAKEQARVDKEYKKWYNSLPASTRAALGAIEITYSKLDWPNSADGCDYTLKYVNKSKKTIKYLYWTGYAYNAVGDIVPCEVRGRNAITDKDTGPVYEGETSGCKWKCVIYNPTARYMVISNIKIVYMDGSTLRISGNDLDRMESEPSRDVHVDTNKVTSQLVSDSFCQGKINYWNGILSTLQNKTSYNGYWSELNDSNYNELVTTIDTHTKQVNDASAEAANIKTKIDTLEKFLGYRAYATRSARSASYTQTKSSAATQTSSATEEDPLVTFGIEVSGEFADYPFVGGGVSLRIGRYYSLFNATIGAKYQFGQHNVEVIWRETDYKKQIQQVVFPVVLNWNFFREDFSMYIGAGYEYGVLISDKDKIVYRYTTSDPITLDDAFRLMGEDYVHLSVPTRSVIIQFGGSDIYRDIKFYGRIFTNKKQHAKSAHGAFGVSLTFYF